MWTHSVVSWLGEQEFFQVKRMGQHICFGTMYDIAVKSHVNVIKG